MQRMALKMAFIYGSMSFKLDINRWDFILFFFYREINDGGFRLIATSFFSYSLSLSLCDLKCLLIMQLILGELVVKKFCANFCLLRERDSMWWQNNDDLA